VETEWLSPELTPEELAPEEEPVLEMTGVDEEVVEELLVPVEPTVCTLPTILMPVPDEPVPETTGVPLGWPATVPGPVTVPEPPTTVVTVPTGLLEPELPLPELVLTGTGAEATGVGVVGVGVGVGVVVPAPVVPLPRVGRDDPDPVLRLGLAATGCEMEAEPVERCDTGVGAMAWRVRRGVLAATAVARATWLETRGLTTATAARPREVEWEPGLGCAISVWVAGEPMPPSLGQPLKARTALPSTNSIEAARTRVPAVPRPAR
jgi:hypothetical protein